MHGIGAVVVESLREVWARSRVRVNNGLDNSIPPYSSQTGGLVREDSYSLSVMIFVPASQL